MLDSLISHIAPHYCLSCGEIGAQICDYCFFNIELELQDQCAKCGALLVGLQCKECPGLADVAQIMLARREGVLQRLVDEYKFECKRATYVQIARCFDAGAPVFSGAVYVVPLPTSPLHVRRRGFDHTKDFSKEFASLRSYNYAPLLKRRHNKAQVGATAAERAQRAATAFAPSGELSDKAGLYVVCDDIVTTGVSMLAAVKCLQAMGAENIAFLVLMRQT